MAFARERDNGFVRGAREWSWAVRICNDKYREDDAVVGGVSGHVVPEGRPPQCHPVGHNSGASARRGRRGGNSIWGSGRHKQVDAELCDDFEIKELTAVFA